MNRLDIAQYLWYTSIRNCSGISPSWLRHRTLTPALRWFKSSYPSQRRVAVDKLRTSRCGVRFNLYPRLQQVFFVTSRRSTFILLRLLRYRKKSHFLTCLDVIAPLTIRYLKNFKRHDSSTPAVEMPNIFLQLTDIGGLSKKQLTYPAGFCCQNL